MNPIAHTVDARSLLKMSQQHESRHRIRANHDVISKKRPQSEKMHKQSPDRMIL